MRIIFFVFLVLSLIYQLGCSDNVAFTGYFPPGVSPNPSPANNSMTGNAVFALNAMNVEVKQDSYPKNIIDVTFQAIDQNGFTLNNLTKNQVFVSENGLNINNFDLKQFSGAPQDVDIIFVIDETTSMDNSIDQVKQKVGGFVDALAASNIRAHLCLVRFTDDVQKVCSSFVEDNPATVANENFSDFMSQLNAIKTHDGGSESDEGQLAALEAATKTPWHPGNQRVAIMVTDAAFHYSPGNADEGKYVPTYQHTLDMVTTAQMQTFVLSIPTPGYDRNFNASPALTSATGGAFYNLLNVLSGSTDMQDIFKNIAQHLQVSYTVEYSIEDNGLDPTLSFDKRSISISLAAGLIATVKIQKSSSSLPTGHGLLRKQFAIANDNVDPGSATVSTNGQQITTGYHIDGGQLTFDSAPSDGTVIDVSYYLANLKSNLNYSLLTIDSNHDVDLTKLVVKVNGHSLTLNQYKALVINSRKFTLDLGDDVFLALGDPFDIKKLGILMVEYSL